MGSILSYIQLAIQFGPIIKGIIDEATTNDDILTKLEAEAAPVGNLIASLGAELFPQASPTLQKVGGVIAAFDPNTTKWLQGALNTLVSPSPNLTVDGLYGPKTKAAVIAVQTKLGLTSDGIAGQITQAAIQTALTKIVPTL